MTSARRTCPSRATATVALTIAASLSLGACGGSDDDAATTAKVPKPKADVAATTLLAPGDYVASIDPWGEGEATFKLWVKDDGIRVIEQLDGEALTRSLGFSTFKGDRLELLIDPERAGRDDWQGKKCVSKTAIGAYRLERSGTGVRFDAVKDACPFRRKILDGHTWLPEGAEAGAAPAYQAEIAVHAMPEGYYAARFDALGTGKRDVELRVLPLSLELTVHGTGGRTASLGDTKVTGDQVVITLPASGGSEPELQKPGCTKPATYRAERTDAGIRLTAVSEECAFRKLALDGRAWTQQ